MRGKYFLNINMKMSQRLKLNWKERSIHDAFLVTVFIKGIDGILEIVLGVLLIFTNTISTLILSLVHNELIEDPDDFFATHLRAIANQSHEAFVLGGLYLVAHGLVKTFLSGALWRNYLWAYPAAMAFLGMFILYQLIRIIQTGSLPLILLTAFDIFMLWLVAHEYMRYPHKA
jgi:uncharacterized membrane protein